MLKQFAPLAVILSYFILALIYIHPGEIPFLALSTTQALSDGTDPQAFPYNFAAFIHLFKTNPWEALWGAVYLPHLGGPAGSVLWMSMSERLQSLFLGSILPIEQVATGFALLGMTLNGYFMFWLGKELKIPRTVSWIMGFVFAINAYTLARARVHMGLVGIFHIPLVFLSIIWLSKNDRRGLFFSTLAFLIVSFFPHYYVVTISLFAPLFALLYFKINPQTIKKGKALVRIVLALTPAALWLGFSLAFPINPKHIKVAQLYPSTGETEQKYHPFLDYFSLNPIDLFSGDIANGEKDLNFIKEGIAISLKRDKYFGGNAHERANGIRWILWIIFIIAAIWLLPSQKNFWHRDDRFICLLLFFFGLISFWLSLPPNWPLEGMSGSLILHKFIPQIRVPNRAAIGISFSIIVIVGLFLKNLLAQDRFKKRGKLLTGLWGFLLFLELPPLYQNLPVAQIDPPILSLTNNQTCGRGFYYPYVSGGHNTMYYYHFLQRMRGANCSILNQNARSELDYKLAKYFARSFSVNFQEGQLEKQGKLIVEFANCSGTNWIVLGDPLSPDYAQAICNNMRWTWKDEGVCLRPGDQSDLPQTIDQCLMF